MFGGDASIMLHPCKEEVTGHSLRCIDYRSPCTVTTMVRLRGLTSHSR
jgi:hypothetical protein